MPVVINEFEIVTEPPAAPRSGPEQGQPAQSGAGASASPAPAALSPKDIERILRRRAERLARIWAH